MIDLSSKLRQLVKFDRDAVDEHWNGVATHDDIESAKFENARLQPLLTALIECVEALELYKGIPLHSLTGTNAPPSNEALSRLQALVEDEK